MPNEGNIEDNTPYEEIISVKFRGYTRFNRQKNINLLRYKEENEKYLNTENIQLDLDAPGVVNARIRQ